MFRNRLRMKEIDLQSDFHAARGSGMLPCGRYWGDSALYEEIIRSEKDDGFLDPSTELLHDVHMDLRSEPFRVMIADDDHIFIEGIAALIREWSEFEFVGRAYTL